MNKKINTDKQFKYLNKVTVDSVDMLMVLKSHTDLFNYPVILGEYYELITKMREVADLCQSIKSNFVKMNSYKED